MKEPLVEWNLCAEGRIYRKGDGFWVVRTGVVVNKPTKQKAFEDQFVCLSSVSGEGNSILGYTLQAKKNFAFCFEQDTYVSLMDENRKHDNLKILFQDQKVYLYRFNKEKAPSYWFLFRNKVT